MICGKLSELGAVAVEETGDRVLNAERMVLEALFSAPAEFKSVSDGLRGVILLGRIKG